MNKVKRMSAVMGFVTIKYIESQNSINKRVVEESFIYPYKITTGEGSKKSLTATQDVSETYKELLSPVFSQEDFYFGWSGRFPS